MYHNRIRWLYTDDKQKMTNQLYSHIALALKKRKENQCLISPHLPDLGCCPIPGF